MRSALDSSKLKSLFALRPGALCRSTRLMLRSIAASLVAILSVAAMTGCETSRAIVLGRPSGDVRVQSLGVDPVSLRGQFTQAVYANGEAVEWSFILSTVSADDLAAGRVTDGQILHIELLWIPRAGSTPIEVTATNASLRYVIISGGEVGVYGGAGFVKPRGRPGDRAMSLSLREASLRLLHSSDGFVDLLTPALASGSLIAELDTRRTRILHHAASQFVTDSLGRSIIVFGDDAADHQAELSVALR
jgi:hypothetical protein